MGTVTPISTKDYLLKKKELDENIQWYGKTIAEVDAQQNARRNVYKNLQKELYELELNYYANGV